MKTAYISCDPDRLLERGCCSVFLARVRRLQEQGCTVFVHMIDKRKIGVNQEKLIEDMEKQENQSADQVMFMYLVQRMYSPTSLDGKTAQPQEAVEYKTSRELQYMFRESCEPTVAEVSRCMVDLKFQGIPKDGAFYWMVYERGGGDAAAHPTE